MDHDGDDEKKDDLGDGDDDNNSTIEVKTSAVCSKIPIPSTVDTSSPSEDNMNPRTSSTTVGSSGRSSKSSSSRGKRNGSSSYVRTYDVKIDHLYDLILALETVSCFVEESRDFCLQIYILFCLLPLVSSAVPS